MSKTTTEEVDRRKTRSKKKRGKKPFETDHQRGRVRPRAECEGKGGNLRRPW